MKTKTAKFMVFLPLFVLGFALTAHAQLTVGPLNPATGFPQWYQDPTAPAAQLEICLDQVLCEFTPPIQGNRFSQRIGFGKRAFFWNAQANIGQRAEMEMGIQTLFTGGVVRNGNQRVRNFIRIDLRNLPRQGTYRVVHPFGTETFNVVPDPVNGNLEVNFVRDVGGRNFSSALNGPVTRFLRSVNPPAGFLGNASVFTRVTGSPTNRNFFRLIGPAGVNLGGPPTQRNVVTTNQFKIMGQVFQ